MSTGSELGATKHNPAFFTEATQSEKKIRNVLNQVSAIDIYGAGENSDEVVIQLRREIEIQIYNTIREAELLDDHIPFLRLWLRRLYRERNAVEKILRMVTYQLPNSGYDRKFFLDLFTSLAQARNMHVAKLSKRILKKI